MVLALHHCCQMKIMKESEIRTCVCQRYVENRKKNLKSLPKISVYESFSQACENNKSVFGHYGP